MSSGLQSLGIIAGNRTLPLTLARLARDAGVQKLVAVAFEGETDPALAQLVDEIVWLRVGQLGKLIKAFQSAGVRQCVMVGQIAPKNLFDLRPDLRAMALLWRLKERNARTIFGGIADELQKAHVELVEATPWLRPILAGGGYHCGPELSAAQKEDVAFGVRMAREMCRLDIGQIVVVKRGTVLAVEAFEGTDACLRRGGELAGKDGGAVAVKLAGENHDLRFDIPCVGPQTIETCRGARIAVLAMEEDKTLLLDRDQLEASARTGNVILTAVTNRSGA